MFRSTSLADVLPLPLGNAREHVTLAESLTLRAGEAGAVVPAVTLGLLQDVVSGQAAVQEALSVSVAARPIDARPARSKVSAGWSSLMMRLDAELGVPDHEDPAAVAAATELHRLLFGEGLLFLAATSHEDAWGGSETLLTVLEGPKAVDPVATLGVGAYARAIRRTHDAFGVAAGFTAPPDPKGRVDSALDGLRRALKLYIGNVMAWHDAQPANVAVADAMLQPYVDWDPPRSAGSSAAEADAGAPAPGLPPEPEFEPGTEPGGPFAPDPDDRA